MAAPGRKVAPARKDSAIAPGIGGPPGRAVRRVVWSRQVTFGFSLAIAAGIAAVAFMVFAAPATGPEAPQGASAAQGDDGIDADLQMPPSSGNATTGLPLPTPTLPSLP